MVHVTINVCPKSWSLLIQSMQIVMTLVKHFNNDIIPCNVWLVIRMSLILVSENLSEMTPRSPWLIKADKTLTGSQAYLVSILDTHTSRIFLGNINYWNQHPQIGKTKYVAKNHTEMPVNSLCVTFLRILQSKAQLVYHFRS